MNPSIKSILNYLEELAPPYLQESYDNAGLITGDYSANCTGILCTLDVTEAVIKEAIEKKCNLVVAHHPVVFKPLKRLTPNGYVERTLLMAIRNDIAIYAIHTNLDNVAGGVNAAIARKIGLHSCKILLPKNGLLSKLYTYVPREHADKVREAIFRAGAGGIGKYAECSFAVEGTGTFRPLPGSDPFIGEENGKREGVAEVKLEFLLPSAIQEKVLAALFQSHPYEEVAYEMIRLANEDQYTGSGLVGDLDGEPDEAAFLQKIKQVFRLKAIRHTRFVNRPVKKVALCGGAGGFLLREAMARPADVFITSDIKYHEYFEADGRILLVDIGHYESEQYTIDLLANFLQDKIPTFAVLKTETNTNPVQYFV